MPKTSIFRMVWRLLPYLILGISFAFLESCQPLSGKITEPTSGKIQGTTIECKGSITGSILGKYIWLLVSETRDSGEKNYWPKEQITYIDSEGNWSANVFEDGPGEEIFISLCLVNEDTHNQFLSWMEEGAKTGSYPGISKISAKELDVIEVKIQ